MSLRIGSMKNSVKLCQIEIHTLLPKCTTYWRIQTRQFEEKKIRIRNSVKEVMKQTFFIILKIDGNSEIGAHVWIKIS